MTTIAWDGKTIASDSQETMDEAVCANVQKIFQVSPGCFFAAAGSTDNAHTVKRWLEAGADQDKKPHISDNFIGILVGPEGAIEYESSLSPIPRKPPYTAGTGWKWAAAALDMGKNARGAIEYAITRDIYSGGEVQSVEINT